MKKLNIRLILLFSLTFVLTTLNSTLIHANGTSCLSQLILPDNTLEENHEEYYKPGTALNSERAFYCTVTLTATFDSGSNAWIISFGGSGAIQLEATAETCVEAVKDIKEGLRAIL